MNDQQTSSWSITLLMVMVVAVGYGMCHATGAIWPTEL